jgi:RNA polymerase sigma-70 factor (ECF subfamily)
VTPVHAALERVARESRARLLAHLAASFRDLAGAEDALAEAFVAALRVWPERGVPDSPEAWLLTAARRTLVDAGRRRDVAARALPDLARLEDEEPAVARDPSGIPDTRLELLFTCAHPAIDPGVRAPLMLQAVLGLDAARIAAAFLVSPASMGQRLVRAKTRIRRAGIPFAVPAPAELPARLESVLDAVHVAYGTGWDDPAGRDVRRRGLTAEALRLARLVVELLPEQPEARGLLAALLHGEARAAARRTPEGAFVPLGEQDVRRWDPVLMAEAERHLAVAAREVAAGTGPPGPYQLQAAIQSVHNRRALTGGTDWAALVALYDRLVALTPSVGAHVARASAHLHGGDPVAALAVLDALDAGLVGGYQPYWVVRAHCLHRTGAAAGHAAQVALGLTEDPALRAHLTAEFAGWDDRHPPRGSSAGPSSPG